MRDDIPDSDADVVEYAHEQKPLEMPLSIESQKEQIKNAGLEGQLQAHEKYTQEALDYIIDAKKKENVRNFIYEQSTTGQALLGFGAGLVAGFTDPVNIASSFTPVPGMGPRQVTAWLAANAEKPLMRAAVRAGEGAAAGALGATLLEPLNIAGQHSIQADYTALNSLMNIGFGAAFGGIIKPAGGALAEWRVNRFNANRKPGEQPRAHSWEYVPVSEESEALRMAHEEQMYKTLLATRAGEDPVKLREMAADTTTAYDIWMRRVAYEKQISVEQAYHGWDINYETGEFHEYGINEAVRTINDANALQAEIAQVEMQRQQYPNLADGYDLDGAKLRLEQLRKKLPQAQAIIEMNNAHSLMQPERAWDSLTANEKLARDMEAWNKTVDNFISGQLPQRNVVPILTKTPLVFKLLGADPDLSISTTYKALRKIIVDKHKLPLEVLKQVPEALADPVMIFKFATVGGDYVVMLDLKVNGASVIVPISLDYQMPGGLIVNFAPSVYTKSGKNGTVNNNWFIEQIQTGNLLYKNNKKSRDWARTSRLQLPGGNIPKINGINKIFTDNDVVNLKKQFPTHYQSAPASRPNALGGNSTVIRNQSTSDPARYEVWEISDIIASHDPKQGFIRKSNYPKEAQERPYHSDVGEQGKVTANARNYQHDRVINTNTEIGSGPPVVTKSGNTG